MANIIAIVWDFDKTLVNGYMQDPIFAHYGIDPVTFWAEVEALPEKYRTEQGVRVNRDTIYLNHFIRYAREGRMPGLNNARLREFGKELNFYPGVPEIFEKTTHHIADDSRYREYNIRVEHYIISTGMTEIIRGSSVMPHVAGIWGCEFIEDELPEQGRVIAEIGYTIDNTTKTMALFEINKGVGKRDGVQVNTKIDENLRRVHFENMIYIADGPSDVPAFSVMNKNGGATFAVYPAGNQAAFRQAERLRADERVQMYAEADYTEGTTAYLWIMSKITDMAEKIRRQEDARLHSSISSAPRHL